MNTKPLARNAQAAHAATIPTQNPTVRGAVALLGGATAAAKPAATNGKRAADRKSIKAANNSLRQASDCLATRRYKDAEEHYETAISLLDRVPPRLWAERLGAAAKAKNHAYVVDNYLRVRSIQIERADMAFVDHLWVECLLANGYLEEALQVAAAWSSEQTQLGKVMRSVSGVIFAALGDSQKAVATQRAILDSDPDFALARWNLALHQLEIGDLPEAFRNYEARWNWPDFPSETREFACPRWNGEALDGKKIIVWREQGIGDEIMFSGLVPDLGARGAAITLECSPKLFPVFAHSFPWAEVKPLPRPADRAAEEYRSFDYHVPLGSLAGLLRPTLADFREKSRPWLARNAANEAQLRSDMSIAPHQPLIGLCWRSSVRNLHRNKNYVNVEHLAALKLLPGVGFLCVQYDECSEEVALARELGLPLIHFPKIDQMNDLASAAALIGACDLVISTRASTAQMAGGLGVPTIMFGHGRSPVSLGTADVPWHPSTRGMKTDPNDQMAVVKQVLMNWGEIAAWAAGNITSGRAIDWSMSIPK